MLKSLKYCNVSYLNDTHCIHSLSLDLSPYSCFLFSLQFLLCFLLFLLFCFFFFGKLGDDKCPLSIFRLCLSLCWHTYWNAAPKGEYSNNKMQTKTKWKRKTKWGSCHLSWSRILQNTKTKAKKKTKKLNENKYSTHLCFFFSTAATAACSKHHYRVAGVLRHFHIHHHRLWGGISGRMGIFLVSPLRCYLLHSHLSKHVRVDFCAGSTFLLLFLLFFFCYCFFSSSLLCLLCCCCCWWCLFCSRQKAMKKATVNAEMSPNYRLCLFVVVIIIWLKFYYCGCINLAFWPKTL